MRILTLFLLLALVSCAAPSPSESGRDRPKRYQLQVPRWGWGTVEVPDGSWHKFKAVDNDLDTWWSADDFAPQWFEITYPINVRVKVAGVELTVSQVAPGPATHKVRLEDDDGKIVAWRRFDSSLSTDGDTFVLKIEPPVYARKVRVLTTRHEGWVAYRELRIFGATEHLPISLSRPVYLTHAGDGGRRLFILEQEGRVRLVGDGILLDEAFLEISSRIRLGELAHFGLLGIAFPPDYGQTGKFYVSYVDEGGQNVLSRFRVSPDNPDKADPNSEEVLISFEQMSETHPIGTLAFGPRDGYLYVGVGDGHGSKSPPSHAAQETSTLYGSILRLDVSPDTGYAIPPDNPFANVSGHAPEIWAYGLRNPWGIAFDRDTGALFIPDVGNHSREEINYQPPGSAGGSNYGWPCWEGDIDTGECQQGDFVPPVVVYGRDISCATVGGAASEGRFIFADFCSGWIRSLSETPTGWETALLFPINSPVSGIGTDEAGNIYALGYLDGAIYMIGIED